MGSDGARFPWKMEVRMGGGYCGFGVGYIFAIGGWGIALEEGRGGNNFCKISSQP